MFTINAVFLNPLTMTANYNTVYNSVFGSIFNLTLNFILLSPTIHHRCTQGSWRVRPERRWVLQTTQLCLLRLRQVRSTCIARKTRCCTKENHLQQLRFVSNKKTVKTSLGAGCHGTDKVWQKKEKKKEKKRLMQRHTHRSLAGSAQLYQPTGLMMSANSE